jgi:hypothetical protein
MHKHERILIEKKLRLVRALLSSARGTSDVVTYSFRYLRADDFSPFLHELAQNMIGSVMFIEAEITRLEKSLLEPEILKA